MGFIDDKKNILNEIKAFTSIKDDIAKLPKSETSSFASVNNSKEIIPFLLDMLTALIGTEVLERVTGELMTGFIREIEPTLKESLKKQVIGFNSEDPLPAGFASGYQIPVKDVDITRKFNTDKADIGGDLLYGSNTNSFDNLSRDAIVTGSDVTVTNMTVNYSEVQDNFTYKPVNTSQTIGEFTNNYIDGITLVDEKEFTTKVMDSIFGTITTTQNKTQRQILLEEKANRTLQKIIDKETDISINDSELSKLELLAEQKKEGITTVDVGCGILNSSVSVDELTAMVNITTGSTDPLTVGQAYTNTMLGGFENENTADENSNTIKDGFFKRLINTIVQILVGALTMNPQIRTLFGITGGFTNNDIPDIGDVIDDLKSKRDLIDCLSDDAKAKINEFVFNLVKKELMDLIIPVSKHILKEKINSYLSILRSLIPFKL